MIKRISIFLLIVSLNLGYVRSTDNQVAILPDTKICKPKADYSINVILNNIDVIVLDKNGKHVTDLTAKDFTIIEDGKERKLAKFEKMDFIKEVAVKTKPVLSNKDTLKKYDRIENQSTRNFSFLISNLPRFGEKKEIIMQSIQNFVESNTTQKDRLSLYHMTQDNIKLIQPFITDRNEFMLNFKGYLESSTFKNNSFNYSNPFEFGEQGGDLTTIQTSKDDNSPEIIKGPGWKSFTDIVEEHTKNEQNDVFVRVMNNTALLADSIKTIPGRKNIVLFSSGLYHWPQSDATYVRIGNKNVRRSREKLSRIIVDAIKELYEVFNTYNISLYVVDVGKPFIPKTTTNFADRENYSNSMALLEDSRTSTLKTIAKETGGQYFINSASSKHILAERLSEIDYQTSFYYNISYYADEKYEPGSYLDVKIEVKKDDVLVKHREGIRIPKSYIQLSKEEQAQSMVESLFNDFYYTDYSLCSDIKVFPHNIPDVPILISAEVPLKEFKIKNIYKEENLLIGAVIKDTQGNIIKEIRKQVNLDLPLINSIKKYEKFRYFEFVVLPTGKYDIRIFIGNIINGKRVSTTHSIEIPKIHRNVPSISSLLLLNENENIMPVSIYSPLPISKLVGNVKKENPLFYKNKLAIHSINENFNPNTKVKAFVMTCNLDPVKRDKDYAIKFQLKKISSKPTSVPIDYTDILNPNLIDTVKHNSGNVGLIYELNLEGVAPGKYQLETHLIKDGILIQKNIEGIVFSYSKIK